MGALYVQHPLFCTPDLIGFNLPQVDRWAALMPCQGINLRGLKIQCAADVGGNRAGGQNTPIGGEVFLAEFLTPRTFALSHFRLFALSHFRDLACLLGF